VNLSKIAVQANVAGGKASEPYRVLLVEDNPTNQRLMRRLLEAMHCSVDVAANGRDALNKVAAAQYELIFMDCHMPVMDGYAATTEIRRREARVHLPIVAVTASIVREDHDRCKTVGMDQVITKPVDPDEIRDALTRWCRRDKPADPLSPGGVNP
jgi:two-component system, sensor histidine kinase SagS